MADRNLSVVLHGKLDVRLEERPIPEPTEGEVQIRIHSVGICGSDVRCWQTGSISGSDVTSPTVTGHEPSGIVSKLGPGVTSLNIGDRVAVEPGISCGRCQFCRGGRYNLCVDMKYCAKPPKHGALCRFYVHPADLCYKLPEHVSLEEGAMLQPLAIAVHACERAAITPGMRVLICGAGPMGLMCLLTAKVYGAAAVVVTEIVQSRLEAAKKFGADGAIAAGDPYKTSDVISRSLGQQPDVTIECSGSENGISTAMVATRSGGRVVQIGYGPDVMSLPYMMATTREVDILGFKSIVNNYPTALSLVSRGVIDVQQLISHRFPLEDAIDAFQKAHKKEAIKIVIQCNSDTPNT